MQLRRAIGNKMFPHLLAVLQWVVLIIILALNLNPSVAVTEAVTNGGHKVIMLFHLWMLIVPVFLGLVFYRIRPVEFTERCALVLSIMTFLFSIADVALHFVDNLVLLMKATELAAWTLYNFVFSISIYKISVVFLLPIFRRFERAGKEVLSSNKKLWSQGQKCEGQH